MQTSFKLLKLGMGFQLRIHELEEQVVITYLINNCRSQWLSGLWPGFARRYFPGFAISNSTWAMDASLL